MSAQTILIISDDADLLQLASLILNKAGAKVVAELDGLRGPRRLFTHHPNQIILNESISGQPRAGP